MTNPFDRVLTKLATQEFDAEELVVELLKLDGQNFTHKTQQRVQSAADKTAKLVEVIHFRMTDVSVLVTVAHAAKQCGLTPLADLIFAEIKECYYCDYNPPTADQKERICKKMKDFGYNPDRILQQSPKGTNKAAGIAPALADKLPEDEPRELTVRKGFGVIFNYEIFANDDNNEMTRHGSSMDRNRLARHLENCGFEVHCYNNLTTKQTAYCIDNIIECLSRKSSKTDFVFVAVLSHGSQDTDGNHIISSYDGTFPFDSFKNEFFRSGLDIGDCPKMILLQACWGANRPKPIYTDDQIDCDGCFEVVDSTKPAAAANKFSNADRDQLVLKASTEGNVSYRSTWNGSPLVRAFCEEIRNATGDSQPKTIRDITHATQRNLDQKNSANPAVLQQPVITHGTMMTDVYFQITEPCEMAAQVMKPHECTCQHHIMHSRPE